MQEDLIKKALVVKGKITEQDFEKAKLISKKQQIPLESAIIQEGILNEDVVGIAVATELGFPFVDLNRESIQDKYMEYLPEPVAVAQQALIFEESEDVFKIATTKPNNFKLIKDLQKIVGKKAEVYYAPQVAIEKFLLFYKNNLPEDFRDFVEEFRNTQNDDVIVKMVDRLIEYAYENKASDIHIEPGFNDVGIRVRVDGLLRRVATYPSELHPKIVFLIKIMSNLRTDEHNMTQDGRFDKTIKKEKFDIRVSILPVTHGENIVMRILAEKSRRLSLYDLGLMPEDLIKIKRIIARPYGMIIVTGATGAGKTTTLYAILQLIDKKTLNVVTIEDPVEYAMEGIQQIQVNEKKELTFAKGLRAIVRQDPDMIMVGEIRDNATASIAINASLTGHVLFSTLHANDTSTVFSRFSELGVESSLVATSISMAVSQKLARRVCPYCSQPHKITDEEMAFSKSSPYLEQVLSNHFPEQNLEDLELQKGTGCAMCGGTGYLGRIGLFEIMEVNDEIRELVSKGALAQDIKKVAIKNNMKPIEYWELYHLLSGTTTLNEILNPIA